MTFFYHFALSILADINRITESTDLKAYSHSVDSVSLLCQARFLGYLGVLFDLRFSHRLFQDFQRQEQVKY